MKDPDKPATPRHHDCLDQAFPSSPPDYTSQQLDASGNVVHIQHGDTAGGSTMHTRSDIDAQGGRFEMSGAPHQREHGAAAVCSRLAIALTAITGDAWLAPPTEALAVLPIWADGYVQSKATGRVPVQVTRVGPQRRWEEVARAGRASGLLSTAETVAELLEAIERKRHHGDPEMILALDAGQPGLQSVKPTVDEFLRVYGPTLETLRFRAVWVVGYTTETTFCLTPGA